MSSSSPHPVSFTDSDSISSSDPFSSLPPLRSLPLTVPFSGSDILWLCSHAMELLATDFSLHTFGWRGLTHEKTPDFNMLFIKEVDEKCSKVLSQWVESVRKVSTPTAVIVSPDHLLQDSALEKTLKSLQMPCVGKLPVMGITKDKFRIMQMEPIDCRVNEFSNLYDVSALKSTDDHHVDGVQRLNVNAFGIPLDIAQRVLNTNVLIKGDESVVKTWICSESKMKEEGEGKVVSTVTSIIFPSMGGKIGSLWSMATDPSKQKKGAGSTLLNKVIEYLFMEKGCELVVLLSSPPGFHLYKKVGFQTIDLMNIYMSMKAQSQSSETNGSEALIEQ